MQQKLIAFNKNIRATRTDLPELQAGDVVKISRKIKEGDKVRTQMFQGMIIAVKGGQSSSPTITVRKVSAGVGVELILPLYSSQVEKIEIVKRTSAGRGKLYYVRTKSAKVLGKKLREVAFVGKAGTSVEEAMKATVAATTEAKKEETASAEEKKEEKA